MKLENGNFAESPLTVTASHSESRDRWYRACDEVAADLSERVPRPYRSRTFSGIIGDIKALSPRQALSLYSRKKGIGLQYAEQYLSTGIDGGKGYQACASTALDAVIGSHKSSLFGDMILDTGCAVGVTAGVLGLEQVFGFDLFQDLIHTARKIDAITGARHRYVTADMTCEWPFCSVFDTVICGLVCHHLKSQDTVARFFQSANRVLKPGGTLIITLPAGSLSTVSQLHVITEGLETFGFDTIPTITGLVRSEDEPHSLFWMFLICAMKHSAPGAGPFINSAFSFPDYRTPVPRTVKGDRARKTVQQSRRIRHDRFMLFTYDMLSSSVLQDEPLVFEAVRQL